MTNICLKKQHHQGRQQQQGCKQQQEGQQQTRPGTAQAVIDETEAAQAAACRTDADKGRIPTAE